MKYLTTNKALKSAHNLVTAGYCELQTTLSYLSPKAYTASKMYGWRCDVYELDGFTIATGYGTPSHGLELPYDTCRQLETECRDKPAEYRLAALTREVTAFIAASEGGAK